MTGGFPCQSFSTLSMANRHRHDVPVDEKTEHDVPVDEKPEHDVPVGQEQQRVGLDDPARGGLFFHLVRLLKEARPKFFLFENVKGLILLDHGETLRVVLRMLEEAGYFVEHAVVDASWFLPQRRERVYFVGVRRDVASGGREGFEYRGFVEGLLAGVAVPSKEIRSVKSGEAPPPLVTRENVGNQILPRKPAASLAAILETDPTVLEEHVLPRGKWEKAVGMKYASTLHKDGTVGRVVDGSEECAQTLLASYRRSPLMHSQFVQMQDTGVRQGMQMQDTGDAGHPREGGLAAEEGGSGEGASATSSSAASSSTDRGASEATDAGGERARQVRSTVMQQGGESGEKQPPRFFTPRECARLQGFPEWFDLQENNKAWTNRIYHSLGNAVAPPVVAAVFLPIARHYFGGGQGEDQGTEIIKEMQRECLPGSGSGRSKRVV